MEKMEVFEMNFVRKLILLTLFACIACGNVAQAVENDSSDKPEAKVIKLMCDGFKSAKKTCAKFSLKSRKAKVIACAIAASLVVGGTAFYIDCRYDNKLRKLWFFLKDPQRAKDLRAFQKRIYFTQFKRKMQKLEKWAKKFCKKKPTKTQRVKKFFSKLRFHRNKSHVKKSRKEKACKGKKAQERQILPKGENTISIKSLSAF
ncbi:hypothetical protein HOD08_00410 [bacterium]|nr:hypothetical protein [bacterium]